MPLSALLPKSAIPAILSCHLPNLAARNGGARARIGTKTDRARFALVDRLKTGVKLPQPAAENRV
jgi:hypothetical protein